MSFEETIKRTISSVEFLVNILTPAFSFRLSDKLQDKTSFIVVSCILRVVSAIGGAAYETAVFATAIDQFPLHTGIVTVSKKLH